VLIDAPVCCECLCAGAHLLSAAPAARVTSAGKPACERCGVQLNRVKHHRPHGAGRACAPRCKSSSSAADAASLPPTPAARSHKRSAPDSGKQQALSTAPPPPTPTLPLHKQATWHTHGWSLHSSSRISRSTAASWLDLATNDELKGWEEKRGGFWQHDTSTSLPCSVLDEKRVRLRHSAERIARQRLSELSVDCTSHRLAGMKLLRTRHGQGLQEIHFDIPEYARAVRCYSVLIYLTPTLSTAVPKSPLSELRHCFTKGEERPSAAALNLLSREQFSSVRVEAGDMLAFNCAVPHYGVANPDPLDRYVLFLLFSPSALPLPDTEDQRYPHGVDD
jgi:hypothetical protein